MSSTTRVAMAAAASTGMATLPVLVATGHPWMGGAGLLLSLASWVLHSRQKARSELAEKQAELSFAHTSVTMGVDPAPVLKALRGHPERSGGDERTGDDPPGLHLPPGRTR